MSCRGHLRVISPAGNTVFDLNLKPPAPETNALPLNQLQLHENYQSDKADSVVMWIILKSYKKLTGCLYFFSCFQ